MFEENITKLCNEIWSSVNEGGERKRTEHITDSHVNWKYCEM